MVHTIKLFRLKVHKFQFSTPTKIWIQFCCWEFMLTFKQPIIITFLQIFQDTCSKFPESKLDNYLLQRDGNRSSIIKFTIFVTWCNLTLFFAVQECPFTLAQIWKLWIFNSIRQRISAAENPFFCSSAAATGLEPNQNVGLVNAKGRTQTRAEFQ